jgi:hypothetical protein
MSASRNDLGRGSTGAVADAPAIYEAFARAVTLLTRCENRLEHVEGLNRSMLRHDIQEYWRLGTARAALSALKANAASASGSELANSEAELGPGTN